jgi:hypothetical protein
MKMSKKQNTTPWYAEIGGQANFYMEHKAFWLRAAAHYRTEFWRDNARLMNALRQVKHANALLRQQITL